MKNVISVSLFGGDQRYFMGTLYNAELAKEFFPDWEFRVYHENGVNPAYLERLNSTGAKVINIGQTKIVGSLWRFLVYDDPEVNYFICRDVDDRLNQHDKELVDIWIESGFPFHIVRSHPGHRNEILAGMWGGKARYFENFSLTDEMLNFDYGERYKDNDQKFLRIHFYNKIKNLALVHGYPFPNEPNVKKFPKLILNHEGQEVYPIGEVYDEFVKRSLFE